MAGHGRLEGKVALITGAARGQGAVESMLFAREGAKVVACDVLVGEGQAVVERINRGRTESVATFCRLDVSCEEDWNQAISVAESNLGCVDVLVNNAAVLSPTRLVDTTEAEWERTMAVNAAGPFLGMRRVVPSMRAAGGGSIVNVASISAITAGPLAAAYHASKGALRSLGRAAAIQFAADGIRVNTVFPGPVDTPMVWEAYPAQHVRRFETEHPMGRMAEPSEIASGVLFLASDESSYMTGSELVIDGGWVAQ